MGKPKENAELLSQLSLLKERFDRSGLHVTARRLDHALRAAGFEAAGQLDALERYERAQDRAAAKARKERRKCP